MKRALLLSGQPGTGKTALIKEALARTRVKGAASTPKRLQTGGIIRQGFRIVTLGGQEAILGHVSIFSPCQVSKYRVDTDAFDRVEVPALRQAPKESDLIVIGETGRIERLSPRFKKAATQAIDSGKKALGTIMLNPHPFADEIKRHPEAEAHLVTRYNRTGVTKKILSWPMGR